MKTVSTIAFACAGLLLPVLCAAAGSGSTLHTGSGALTGTAAIIVIPPAKTLDPLVPDRMKHAQTFNELHTEAVLSWDAQMDALIRASDAKRANTRSSCRLLIRQANKETLWPVTLNCVRSDISEVRALLPKLLTFADGTPPLQTQVSIATGKARVALSALAKGIDTGVFTNEASLVNAKQSLRVKYLQPMWTSWTNFRAYNMLQWTSWMINAIDETDSGSTVLDRASWEDARACFVDVEVTLKKPASTANISAAKAKIDTCALSLKKTLVLQTPPPPQAASGSTLPKK